MNQQEVWNKIAEPWTKFRKKAPLEVENFLKAKKGKILDLGCGSGRNIISNSAAEYYGVDFSEEMLKLAEKKARDFGIKAVFFKADIGKEKLPFQDEFFDSAIFISALHCIQGEKERRKAVEELYRVLKKGGEAMISAWNKEANTKLTELKAKEGYLNWKNEGRIYSRYYCFYEREELQQLLESAGFKIVKSGTSGDEKHSKKNLVFYVKR